MIKNIVIYTIFLITISLLSGCEQKTQNQTPTKQEQVAKSEAEVQAIIAKDKEKVQIAEKDLIKPGKISDGEKLYREKLQQTCKMSGYALARKKTKEEWKEIAKNGKFAETIKSLCPNSNFNNIWTPDIYEFLYKHAISSES